MYSTPPMINQGEYAETLNIIIPMHWDVVSEWEDTTVGKRGQAYESFKYGMLEKTLDKLSLIIPNIKELIEKVDMSSPLTIRDYTGATHGAMCGMRKECNDPLVFMPVVTRIKELFITGQDVNMHGFCGVSLTAIQTCEAILGKNYLLNKLSEKQ